MKIHAIVQARMWSERLPGKTLLELKKNETILSYLINTLKESKYINNVIVATTDDARDDKLCQYCIKNDYNLYRGSASDVLKRFYNTAVTFNSDIIVRITADDPFKDIDVIDECIEALIRDKSLSYVSNTITPTFPEGIDVEVFTFLSLKKANYEAVLNSEREHVTPHIWRNTEKFNVKCLFAIKNYSNYRITIDYPSDYEVAKKIVNNFYPVKPNYKQIVEFLDNNPQVRKINSNIIRNEGYLKSIKEESNE